MKIPNTPFSTRLSGSAKETELRLRSIFQWKKKRPPVMLFVLVALLVLMCCSLVSCRVEEPPTEESPGAEITPGVGTTPEVETIPEVDNPENIEIFEEQLRLIAECVGTWAVPAEYANERYAYCVTDLDGNGQLELIAANYGGTGHYTYSRFYQVNRDCTALVPCDYATNFPHDGQSEVDIIDYTVDAYRNSNGLTWYIFDDYGKWGGAEYPEVKLSLHLSSEGLVDTIALAWKHSVFTEGGILDHTTCADWLGTEWSDAESEEAQTLYDTAADRYFAGCQKLSVTFGWQEMSPEKICGMEDDELYSLLNASLLGFTATEAQSAAKPVAETEVDVYTLENLSLDGEKINDDSLTVTVVRPHDGTEGHVAMTVRLGTGQELEYEVTKGRYICNGIFTPYLTSTERQTIVLELAYWGANWAGCDDILLEVKDGAVAEVCVLGDEDTENALNTQSALYGLEVVDREDSTLQALRVPTYVMKWHGPDIGTLTWEDGQWKFVTDGYYTDDWYTAVVDGGMELTISLRGRTNREKLIWYYDQIQILHGNTVIQTITEDSFKPDDHCRFDFFNADVPNKLVHVRDINFDGNEDFAVSCNRYHNDGYCWFLYDPQLRQFRYAFSLSGQPELDVEQKQIVETWQDDYGENITYNTYEYNRQGKLILIESRKEADRASNSASAMELLQSVLTGGEFISADSGETLTLEQLRQRGFSDDDTYPAIPEKLAVVEMDHDGTAEVVIQLKIGAVASFLILRVQNETVYGYRAGLRSLMDLKTDGTFEWSGGAFDCGSASIRFTEYLYIFNGVTYREPYTTDKITYCDSRSDPDGRQLFFADGEPATADEFEAAISVQQAKPGVTWYDFTDENIKTLVKA